MEERLIGAALRLQLHNSMWTVVSLGTRSRDARGYGTPRGEHVRGAIRLCPNEHLLTLVQHRSQGCFGRIEIDPLRSSTAYSISSRFLRPCNSRAAESTSPSSTLALYIRSHRGLPCSTMTIGTPSTSRSTSGHLRFSSDRAMSSPTSAAMSSIALVTERSSPSRAC